MNRYIKNKRLYTPIQPAVKSSGKEVFYYELFPDEKLSNHIYCYWQLKSRKPLPQSFLYRGVADGCIDIITECQNPFNGFIVGFCSTYNLFPLENSFNYIGIRFLPAAFPSIFHIDASELTNKMEWLQSVSPKVSEQIGQIIYGKSDLKELKLHFDAHFFQLLCNLPNIQDKRLDSALNKIFHSQGNLIIKDLDVGLSARQLRRLFEFYLGDTPKAFSKVVRFQSILKSAYLHDAFGKKNFFYDFGYYDQAHFIKDFKILYGLPPAAAFK